MKAIIHVLLGFILGTWFTLYIESKPPKFKMEPARIWSKKCMLLGKMHIAKQADGGKWTVQCV